ncbi:molybdate ABC transporter permease subunit [Cetobacterium sp. 8H]|uniref:molybdate ABC transporter permease subunit n=1 Tax=Cetobacterium sp. 8H TaxID=2759681 RepID=UPI00163BAE54|nr:molybdate ABC transporter permease subunit [Cetobacterium sp. 8H]MBC2851346.1 molybdate ABC transporter permease subunit [Cetobacterium sp. 8H]
MNSALRLSIIITSSALIFNFIFSILLYFSNNNKNSILKKTIEFFITIPIFLPPSVIGYILIIFLGRNSFVGQFFNKAFNFKFLFTVQGAIIAAIIVSLPIIYQTIKVSFDSIDKAYIETALCLGVSKFNMLRHIYLPLSYSKILSGFILGIGRAFGEFGATILIAGNIPGKTQTLPLALYSAIESGDYLLANKILLILLTFSGLFLGVYIFFSKKES